MQRKEYQLKRTNLLSTRLSPPKKKNDTPNSINLFASIKAASPHDYFILYNPFACLVFSNYNQGAP